jgi:hypothetical protein
MTAKTVWSNVESVLWNMATVYMFLLVYGVIVYPKIWQDSPLWAKIFALFIIGYWWAGFKKRLAKFLRESIREMIVEELAHSRIAFVTWLREDAPWRGENPFRLAQEPSTLRDGTQK